MTLMYILVLGLGCAVLASAHPPNYHSSPDRLTSSANGGEQIFLGRFISTPTPDQLLIQDGAVLVSSADGRGVINAVAWNVSSPAAAITALGVANGTTVVTSNDQGFFFPGFIGSIEIPI
jgi:hypothetical protein